MSDRVIHLLALFLIALALIGKIISLFLIGALHLNLKWLEFFSIGVYFAYLAWLGFTRRESGRPNARYVFEATVVVLADILIYYIFRGWV